MTTFSRKMGDVNDLHKAVNLFAKECEDEGASVDISNVDWKELEKAIQDEYNCGADGSIYDVIVDLNDCIGLDEFRIYIRS